MKEWRGSDSFCRLTLTLQVLGMACAVACDRNILHPGANVPSMPVAPPTPVPAHPDGTCDAGLVACGGAGAGYCFDVQAAPDHCGACGNACPLGIPCEGGKCRTVPCTSRITVKTLLVELDIIPDYQVGIADFDRDGALDLLLPHFVLFDFYKANTYRGQGDGTFVFTGSFPAGPNSYGYGLAVADLNLDQIPDLVMGAVPSDAAVPNDQKIAMTAHLGNGDGTFGPEIAVVGASVPSFITLADLDGDGAPDLATVSPPNQAVTFRHGNGDGTFGPAQDLEVGGTPISVLVTDWNADGVPDLLAADDYAHVLLGTGHGGFASALECGLTTFGQNGPLSPPVIADFDRDGRVDMVVNNTLMLGMEDCNFSRQTTFHVSYDSAFPMAAGDFNGDGHADLAIASWEGVGYLAGDGLGDLGDLVHLGDLGAAVPGINPTAGRAGDFNGDGRLDLLIANQFGVRVFMNTCQ